MRTDITKINEKTPHQDLTEGLMVFAGGTSKLFNTGEWRTNTPVYVADKCKQCLLCTPTCPDGCIPVVDGKRLAFDMDHCKGCGICANVCPERMGAPITAYNRISQDVIRVHSNIYHPDYVVVVDETLLESVDVTAGLKKEGAIIVI